VQVTHREVRAVDEDRLEDSGPLGEVLDVLLAAVFPWWCGAGSLGGHPSEFCTVQGAKDGGVRERGSATGGTRFGSVSISAC